MWCVRREGPRQDDPLWTYLNEHCGVCYAADVAGGDWRRVSALQELSSNVRCIFREFFSFIFVETGKPTAQSLQLPATFSSDVAAICPPPGPPSA